MKPYHDPSILSLILANILFPTLLAAATTQEGTGGCKPSTWEPESGSRPDATRKPRPRPTRSVPRRMMLEAGDVNCRYWAQTYEHVDSLTCQEMADQYTDINTFYELNPILESDCKNIRPFTEYCVGGC